MEKAAHREGRKASVFDLNPAILLLLLALLCISAQAFGANETASAETAPAKTKPAKTAPSKTAPLETKPSETAPVAGPHDKLACEDCHKSHGMAPPVQDSRACLKCHEDQAGGDSHPTGVVHEGDPPKGLPLSKDGKLTCGTCHVLHETKSPARALLRKKFNKLCISCHYPDGNPKDHSPHEK